MWHAQRIWWKSKWNLSRDHLITKPDVKHLNHLSLVDAEMYKSTALSIHFRRIILVCNVRSVLFIYLNTLRIDAWFYWNKQTCKPVLYVGQTVFYVNMGDSMNLEWLSEIKDKGLNIFVQFHLNYDTEIVSWHVSKTTFKSF